MIQGDCVILKNSAAFLGVGFETSLEEPGEGPVWNALTESLHSGNHGWTSRGETPFGGEGGTNLEFEKRKGKAPRE